MTHIIREAFTPTITPLTLSDEALLTLVFSLPTFKGLVWMKASHDGINLHRAESLGHSKEFFFLPQQKNSETRGRDSPTFLEITIRGG